MENTTPAAKGHTHHIIMAGLAVVAALFLTTSVISCNGKARAEERYNDYHAQAVAAIQSKDDQISRQQAIHQADSLTITGYQADMETMGRLAVKATATIDQMAQLAAKRTK